MLRFREAQQQMQQGRLTAPGGSHQGDITAGRDLHTQILQGPRAALAVAVADRLKVNGALERTGVSGTGLPFRRAGQQALAGLPFQLQADQVLNLVTEQLAAGQLQGDQRQHLQRPAGVQAQPNGGACAEQGAKQRQRAVAIQAALPKQALLLGRSPERQGTVFCSGQPQAGVDAQQGEAALISPLEGLVAVND